ncbi:MAG TPA: glycosyltransferase family 2 protein [bacterium]|nr:glycosyltransferase family 2 protein [bacterium]
MRFSVIIPAYRSDETLAACLQGFHLQRYADYELILVDSSPNDRCRSIAERYGVHLIRSEKRLWMHQARAVGIAASQGEILVFTDPDCVPAPDWLEQIDEAARAGHRLIGGAIACFPGGYWTYVAHQAKFWLWQPGRPPRVYDRPPFDSLATANLAIDRDWYKILDGLDQKFVAADTLLCFHSSAQGVMPYFQSTAVVHHIHVNVTLATLVRERWQRGQDYFRMRRAFKKWPSAVRLVFLLGWLFLVLRTLYWQGMQAWRTRTIGLFAKTWPWLLVCNSAWMLGQTWAALQSEHRSAE